MSLFNIFKVKKMNEYAKTNSRIQVLGGGCSKCHELLNNAKLALKELGVNEEVEFITNFEIIASYGVMSIPALVIDKKVVSYGKVIKKEEIIQLYKDVAKKD
ncbi:MAG: thioredoxin family protein [Succinivibrionaceae bacterium]